MATVVEKLRKLLALADDQSGTPEGELAAKLAAKLMREHAISMAEIGDAPEADPIINKLYGGGGASKAWRQTLGRVVATHCSCRTYTSQTWNGRRTRMLGIIGHSSDVEVAVYLYEICSRQIEAAAKAFLKSRSFWDKADAHRTGAAFRESAVRGLRERLREIRDAAKTEDATGTALVLRRGAAVKAWENEHMRYDGTYSARSVGYHSEAGYRAGKNVDIFHGVRGPTGNGNAGLLGG